MSFFKPSTALCSRVVSTVITTMAALLSSKHYCVPAWRDFTVLQETCLDNLKYREIYHCLRLGAPCGDYDFVSNIASRQAFSR